jgi:probable addiction module antidote protein
MQRLADPAEAETYLNAGLADSIPAFLKALGNVVQARQTAEVARQAGVQRETLYRSLSETGNPTLGTLSGVLKVLGLRIAIETDAEYMPPPTMTATHLSPTPKS